MESTAPSSVKPSNVRLQLEDLAFGSVAGMVGKVIEYPFDTVKVKLQTQSVLHPLYAGPMACLKATVRQDGLPGLFKGMSSPIIGAMLENAILFVGYRQIQRAIRSYSQTPPEEPLSLNQLVLAGAMAGTIVSFVLTPVELIKCRLQVQRSATGPRQLIKQIYKQQGMRGFFKGFMPTCVRETGGSAFWFGAYEYSCRWILLHNSGDGIRTKKDLSAAELMLAGACGGIAYNVSFFPVDVIKSRMQISTGPSSFREVAKEIYRGARMGGFYRGCGMTAAKSAPANAIIFMTYELLTRYLGSS
ncbi:mitochondrial carrier domain-containing protein [Mucor mucedo]|uniref:mitochondrial carrier domain-containing protein n=1 Tax=Mucor mucedo TaxID=29922 RepID=UPI00221E5D71|nr:mitochondrial carrier domain-containing protein [Mucor mucedo]KAI7874615.1 mitochondrial carrier domain-containing protein [Mucor mucedo]